MSIYAKTRKRKLVEMLSEHGICISYDRVLEISAQLGDATVSKYVEDGVVCPPVLRKGLSTTSTMDNIDHNPTATTANSSFHGTSVCFPAPGKGDKGEERGQLKFSQSDIKCLQDTLSRYERASAARVNWAKSSALLLGRWREQVVPSLPGGLQWETEGL
ncbi:hypothetical protein NHX12_024123 [Muraenolepis orangiensis]|uniref:Uncharacterized protein n=1 Tax=Muraenolepis orangiensis TaxID=630683 RepID=A0A9Q0EQ73_9TELE|nr:hypothetical protein NHX12_024123 [Muraenolepis orangiensis]